MKIGFLITYFYPKTGGAENNCYYTARELAKSHEVHVFCSGGSESEEIIDGINVHRSKELFRLKYYFAFYPSIVNKIQKYDLDVLHVHGLGFVQHDIAVKKLKKVNPKIKVICTPHGPFMALNKYNLIGRIFKSIYTPLIKRSLKMYDAVVEVNPNQTEWMTKDYGIERRKIKFVPNGLNESTFESLKADYIRKIANKYGLEGKFVISYLGRIQKYKGLDQVIKVLPKLLKDYPNLVFVAIGKDADDMQRLIDLSKKRGIAKNVIFTGEIFEKEKLALLEISEIFVFPSEWEAFGIAMLEAMARGNAAISTKTEGGVYLIKKDNGRLYDFGKTEQLYVALSELIGDDKTRIKMGKKNIDFAKKFLWPSIAKQLEGLYGR